MSLLRALGAATLFLGLVASAGEAAADEKASALSLRLSDQANAIWSALPADASDPRLTRLDDAPAECVSAALAEARRLLEPGARAALRDVSLALTVPRGVADRLARGETAPSLLAPYVAPDTRGPHVAQPLGDDSCGAYYELRGDAAEPGRLVLGLWLEAGCGCTRKAQRVQLRALAPLTPGVMEKKDVLRLSAGQARYEVLASCEPCETAAAPTQAARAALPGGPCDSVCAPLTQGLAAWQRKVTDAAARLEGLVGKATTLQLQVSSDRQELAGAQSARSKPRAVLEKISALQARIKSAEAELTRVRQASQDVERTLSALRRVTGDTEGAEGRCRAQCQARPPQQQQQSVAESGSSGAAGGGISTGVLIAGGAALAAGGAVALANGGSDEPSQPAGPIDISGLWRGTKIVVSPAVPGIPTPCRRVFDEDWQIRQDGTNLDIAVTTIVTDCGPPTCSAGCTEGPPPFLRRHTGYVSGSIAYVNTNPDNQLPECTLPLAIQGSTMSGSTPSCPLATEVFMQRVTR